MIGMLLSILATDDALDVGARMAAAEALARVNPAEGQPLVTDITLEMAGGYY